MRVRSVGILLGAFWGGLLGLRGLNFSCAFVPRVAAPVPKSAYSDPFEMEKATMMMMVVLALVVWLHINHEGLRFRCGKFLGPLVFSELTLFLLKGLLLLEGRRRWKRAVLILYRRFLDKMPERQRKAPRLKDSCDRCSVAKVRCNKESVLPITISRLMVTSVLT